MWVRENKPGLEPIKVPTAIDIAWAAGIYEGEGTCSSKSGAGGSYGITVSQKDPELLYRLRDWFGGSVIRFPNGKFECHRWAVSGDKARGFLAAIYPFMTARRKSQIDATNAKLFLEYVADLLKLDVSSDLRFHRILQKVEEYRDYVQYENKSARQEYIRNWQNRKYREDPVYREKRLAAKRDAKRLKRQQKLNVIEMQKTA
jgi:hypothetical protein